MPIRARLAGIGEHWYAACALVLAGVAAALGLLWVGVVPMFESPDEPAHFDYAYALASAGTLLRAQDGRPAFDPRVAAAMADSDFKRIAFNVDETVPPGYGTPAFAARVERDAARAYAARAPGATRPQLAATYPVLPYLLYALAIAPVRSDVVASLYAARCASVLLTALGLLVWSRILPRLGLRPATALFVLAVGALFPLTSFVASYVQPDGVAFPLAGLVLWCALRIRDGATDKPSVVGYGLALAALVGTKPQFALAVGVATIVPVVLAHARRGIAPARRWALAAAVALPLLAVTALDQWTMAGSTDQTYYQGSHTLTSALSEHAAGGGGAAAAYVVGETGRAWADLFGGGTSFRSFWGIFGWLDTPLVIGGAGLSALLARIELIGTALAALGLLVSLAGVARRLVAVARERSPRTALVLLGHDPVLNAYLVFALLLLALYIASNDLFGAQGRNWYALELVAFLVAIRYAVRPLPRRLRRVASGAAMAFLAFYATVGAAYAITNVEDRYYHPAAAVVHPDPARLAPAEGAARLQLDFAAVPGNGHLAPPLGTIRAAAGDRVELYGWAYDPAAVAPCGSVYNLLDERFAGWVKYGVERSDVSDALHDPRLRATGFHDLPDLRGAAPGSHRLALVCVSAGSTKRYPPVAVATIEVTR